MTSITRVDPLHPLKGLKPLSKASAQHWGVLPVPGTTDDWTAALWAPQSMQATLVLDGTRLAMERGADGVHRARFRAAEGSVYGFDLGQGVRPDPAARAQAGDVHGLSQLTRRSFDWPETEAHWAGRPWAEAVILELHIGLFTPEGTLDAAAARLPQLAAMGITGVELMPVGQFPGTRGWGYDGVLPFAVQPEYGGADGLKAFVAAAHAEGIAVMLDVVYNHFGPEGNYLHEIAPEAFRHGEASPWGVRLDYAQPAVRDFVLSNVRMWIGEFHLDGLRIDAAHEIRDPTLVDEIAMTARAAAGGRILWLVLEDERNLSGPTDPRRGLYDAQWNDDYHHALHVLLTDERDGYYLPYADAPMDHLMRALAEGQVFQGEPGPDGAPRGEPSDHLPPTAFVNSNQTHDQVGNRAEGERLIALAGEDAARVAHALLLLGPHVPMLFMGEEAGETAPFLYFCDLCSSLQADVEAGRRAEFAAFPGHAGEVSPAGAPETFERSRPYLGDPARRADWERLTADLLCFRHDRVVPLVASGHKGRAEVRQLGPRSILAAWPFRAGRLDMVVNLGALPAADVPVGGDFCLGDPARDPWALTARVTP